MTPPPRTPVSPGFALLLVAPALLVALAMGAWWLPASGDAPAAAQPARTPTASATPFRPPATTTPTVTAGQGQCAVTGRQSAPARVERWLPLELAITLQAQCPEGRRAPADILLAIDRSTSMQDGDKFAAAQEAVRQFVAQVDWTRQRVGLIPFSDRAWVAQPLTERSDRVLSTLDDLDAPSGGTNIGDAIRTAHRELGDTGRSTAVGVIVVLTDGRQSSQEAMVQAAQDARQDGIVLFAIGLGEDADAVALRAVVRDPSRYYDAPGPDRLAEIYGRIASIIRSFHVTDVRIVELPAPGVEHIEGSGQPEEPERRGSALTWERRFLSSDPFTLTRKVRIARTGSLTPSANLWVEYADGDGTRRRVSLKRSIVEVFAPTIRHIHLPFMAKRWCFPARRHADVALVLDASNSMDGGKLAQAVAGAEAFVQQLNLQPGGDRAAVIRYDRRASVVQPLTRDRGSLKAALLTLRTGAGTRIDRGLSAGLQALSGAREGDNRRVVVLLTDGRQTDEPEQIVVAASRARRAGVIVHAVALGADADLQTLRQLSGDPARVWVARDAGALVEIYRAVAGAVGCR